MKHTKQWITVEHSAKSESIDVVFGKASENRTRQPFNDPTAWPISISDTETGMKAQVDFDDEADKFLLDLNGEAFESLTYLDPTYCADEAKAVSFGGKIWVNGKLVTD